MENRLVKLVPALALSLLVFCLLAIPAGAAGLGVGPAVLTIEKAAPGKDYVKTIFIDNTETGDGIFLLAGTGDIASWITFYPLQGDNQPITQISIPAKGTGYASAKFSIPASASPLVYTGRIMVTGGAPAATAGGGVQISIQMPIEVRIEMAGAPAVIPKTTTPVATAPAFGGFKTGDLNLLSMNYGGQPAVGETTKVQALTRNLTGADTTAYLLAEVYLGDKLIDTVKSEPLVVPSSGTNTLTAYYKPQQAGDYTLKGQVIYQGRQTEQQTVQMKVAGPASGVTQNLAQSSPASGVTQNSGQSNPASISPLLIAGIAVGALVVIGLLALAFLRQRK